jgi:hypothetical protein
LSPLDDDVRGIVELLPGGAKEIDIILLMTRSPVR